MPILASNYCPDCDPAWENSVGKSQPDRDLNSTQLDMSKRLPQTTAHVRITHQSWQQGRIEGEVHVGDFEWQFQWRFRQGELFVEPSLGRALIKEPLTRFLEQSDYQLEPGGDYSFTIRASI